MASAPAYVEALKLLARRELTAAQVRDRLARRGHGVNDIDDAVARLEAERAIDDRRAAEAIARTEVVKRRGRLRARHQLQKAGVGSEVAAAALDAVFGALDQDALIDAALARRLRGGAGVADDRQRQRLYRFLAGQGFDHDRIMRALDRREKSAL